MTNLSKLNFTTVQRVKQNNPKMTRRAKLLEALKLQLHAHSLYAKDEVCFVSKVGTVTDADGNKRKVEKKVELKRWFFEKDKQWIVQCKYGTKTLLLNGKDNAILVNKFEDVKAVLNTLISAVENGEMDNVVENALLKKA